jgi:hypothetical protein
LVSVFHASKKFDSDLELDAEMHKTECATRDMIGNVGVPFSFHHKIILNLTMVSQFTGNVELTHAHPCLPMDNNIEPMPTQNPWARVGLGMGMGTRCRALVPRAMIAPALQLMRSPSDTFYMHP